MYSVTVCFLVFQATNFEAVGGQLIHLVQLMFGADIALRNVLNWDRRCELEEEKIRNLLDSQLIENGGLVSSYTMPVTTTRTLFEAEGREKMREFVLGPGLNARKN
jgi:hypothetical protein